MENLIDAVSVPLIATLVFSLLTIYKQLVTAEKWIRLIPVIAVILGIALGIAAFYGAPGIIPAKNVFTAIIIGAASGLAATGTHQIYKQLSANGSADTGQKEDGGAGGENTK